MAASAQQALLEDQAMRAPNFFIIGAPKCGTTSLASWLGQHPGIFVSTPKEPHFFNTDMNNRSVRGWQEYLGIFSRAGPGKDVLGEASTWYLYSATAVAGILASIPEARFIICLRNPCEMALSLHNQQVVDVNEDLQAFEDAWLAQADRRQGLRVPRLCVERKLLLYKDVCSLGSQFERVLGHARRERVHVVVLDDLSRDPRGEFLKVVSFLGLEDDGRAEFEIKNARHSNRSRTLAYLSKRYRALKRDLDLPRLGTGILPTIRRYNTGPWRPAAVAPAFLAREVCPALLPEIEKLEELLGRDLAAWKKPDG